MYSKIIRKLTRLISQKLFPNNCLYEYTFHNRGFVHELEKSDYKPQKSVFEVGKCIVKKYFTFC